MLLPEKIRIKIERRFGKPVVYHKDCEALSESVKNAVNERISVTTLKRLYGIDKDFREPRKYTLDILAQYLGYKDWASLNESIERGAPIESEYAATNPEIKNPLELANEKSKDSVAPANSTSVVKKDYFKNRLAYVIAIAGVLAIILSSTIWMRKNVAVRQNHSNNTIDLSNGLVAYWPFNGNANDESGNGNNGTVNDAKLTTDRFGEANKAYGFNGVSSFILAPVIKALPGSKQLTFSVWIRTDYDFKTPDNSAMIFDQGSFTNPYTGVNIGFALCINPDNTFGIGFLGGVGQNTAPRIVVPRIWNNLTIVFDGAEDDLRKRVSIYLDGSFVGDIGNKTAPDFIGHLANRTTIGASVGPFGWPKTTHTIGGFFHGELDDIRIYNRVLNEQEIAYIASH